MIWLLDHNEKKLSGGLSNHLLVDGSFDPIHEGHIDYFRQAFEYGLPVACLIAPESYTRQKHTILLPKQARAIVLDSIKFLDVVIISEKETHSVIEILRPKIFFKGGDWRDKLPESLLASCNQVNCEIRYGENAKNSSSQILSVFKQGVINEF